MTAGYEFNSNTVTAQSGKNKFKFDIKEQGFAWIADTKIEFRMIKRMKKRFANNDNWIQSKRISNNRPLFIAWIY